MAEERLIIDGKSFISSIRAAQLFGYTKDYVGQLARAGKIESQLIGRSWYVDEDSIRKHKLSVHYTLTKPKKTRKHAGGLDGISRDDVHEKAIQNIDISDEEQIPVRTSNERIFHNNNHAVDTYEQQNDDAHDLFPRPTKNRANDALVKSDFRFETNPPLSYTHDIVPIHGDSIVESNTKGLLGRAQSGDGTGTKPTEHSWKRGVLRKNTKETGEFVAMDGILVPRNASAKKMPTLRTDDNGDVDSDFDTGGPDSREHFDEYENEDTNPEDNRPSRLLSIIGAIIIFLVLTILYLVV